MKAERRARLRWPAFLGLVFCALATAGTGALAQTGEAFSPPAALERLQYLAGRLEAGERDKELLREAQREAEALGERGRACVRKTSPEVERLTEQNKILEDVDPTIDTALWDQRVRIRNELTNAQARLSTCREIVNQASDLSDLVADIQAEISAAFLWERRSTIIGLIRAIPQTVPDWPSRLRKTAELDLEPGVTEAGLLWLLLAAAVVSAAAGLFIRHRFMRWFQAVTEIDDTPRLKYLFPKPLANYAPLLLEGAALTSVLFLTIRGADFDLAAMRLAAALFLFGVGAVIIDWATGPLSPSAKVPGLIPDHVQPLRLRMRVLLVGLVVSYVVLGPGWLGPRATVGDNLLHVLLLLAVAISLLSLLIYIRRIPGLQGRFRFLRFAGVTAVLTAVGAAALGYHNLSSFMIHGLVRTALALFALWILLWLVFRAFEGLVEGEAPLAQRVRDLLGAAERESRTSFGFIQLVIDLFLWISFVVYVIYVWDSSGNTLDRLEYRIFEGWEIGQLELVPSEIVKGLLILTALIVVTGWIKRWIDRRWLRHMALDRGARDALVTLFGYVGVVIAILIGLNVAGIDLTGLAWFVTALGLGIGFGLQAIASNFVSGLILLFERPIKAGDFVTVGGTEGFVRRVRIRATDIETLDNQNVLVPNSELVSGRVTNWVFRNPQGRLRIEVGVAYGSDIEKVRDILETIAREHPEVITDGRAPAPRALFMAFGESSLNFELRVRIKRIERRFTVISDINFAVDKAFREAGITIPFPQRDLHLISLPEQAKMDAAAEARREHEAEPAPVKPKAPPPVHPEEMTRSHTHEIRLTNRLETVWSTVTDEKWLVRWYARDAQVEPHIGGSYRVEFEDDSVLEGRIDIFMPPRRMRVVMVPPEGDEHLPTGPITEEYIIREADEAVVLTIKVAGIPATEDWEEYYRSSEERWEQALAELQKVLKNRATAR
ncbi:mechanosensitive ion channel domain-containing protein [Lentisalinibacter salinarum]|uniref:mechanosensitive ion channel domain-containing protein n=1 Tax=Lentisalinibacter salinarum TaxID=2992239 RepID=UPI00386E83EF